MNITFSLPFNGELLIKAGQKVDFKDPIAKKQAAEEITIPLASILKVSPNAIFKSLKKFVGEAFSKGDLIAEHKGMLGSKKYHSEFDGIIKEINHTEGTIVVETTSDKKDTEYAFFKGEVEDIADGKVTLKVDKYVQFELKEANNDFGGETLIITEKVLPTISSDDVNEKVIFAEKLQPYDQVKLETLGIKGLITLHPHAQEPSVPKAILKEIQDWEKIQKQHFPYCIISKNNNTIYFYA